MRENREQAAQIPVPCPNCKAESFFWDGVMGAGGLKAYCRKCRRYVWIRPEYLKRITDGR